MNEPQSHSDLKTLKPVFDAVVAPTMIIDVLQDRTLRYGMLNKAAESFYTITHEEYRGKPILPYLGEDEERRIRRDKTIAAYNRCVDEKVTISLDMNHVRSDGEMVWGQHQIVPIINDGVVTQLMVTSTDVSELIRTRERLEDALTRTLSDFMTICSRCKDVKSDDNWVSIEEYASSRLQFDKFSHGLCPGCAAKEVERFDPS